MKHWLNEGLEMLKVLRKAKRQSNKKSKDDKRRKRDDNSKI